MTQSIRRYIGLGVLFLFTMFSFGWYIYLTIDQQTEPFVVSAIEDIQFHRVGLVLGTSNRTVYGTPNPYFVYRINSAVTLYKNGKIEKILVSGDNSDEYYNEPQAMREALLEKGVLDEDIVLDYAGFRTLDSVIRAKEVFGLTDMTIISQQFHTKRAVYIARTLGVDAVGFEAQDVPLEWGIRVQVREYFARIQAWMDVHLLNTQPKFLGDPELI